LALLVATILDSMVGGISREEIVLNEFMYHCGVRAIHPGSLTSVPGEKEVVRPPCLGMASKHYVEEDTFELGHKRTQNGRASLAKGGVLFWRLVEAGRPSS
jgi:hypothetical protein